MTPTRTFEAPPTRHLSRGESAVSDRTTQRPAAGLPSGTTRDWESAAATRQLGMLVEDHRYFLSRGLPRLEGMLAKVVLRYGLRHARLQELTQDYVELASLAREAFAVTESMLYPQLERAAAGAVDWARAASSVRQAARDVESQLAANRRRTRRLWQRLLRSAEQFDRATADRLQRPGKPGESQSADSGMLPTLLSTSVGHLAHEWTVHAQREQVLVERLSSVTAGRIACP